MLDRLILAGALILLGFLAYRLYKGIQLRRHGSRALGLPGFRIGQATIVYFTTPTCAPCRTVQRPALEKIQGRFGHYINVLEFDASQQTRLADSWGVLSVPTTFIIDRQGRPRGVNHGVARANKLAAQLQQLGLEPVVEHTSKAGQLAPSRKS